jgi:4-amino-4-deoxy-L-arabinose transferase-like glycosyltransferase
MKRRLLNLLTALSLLLCVAVVVVWVRSTSGREMIGWRTRYVGESAMHQTFRGLIWSRGDVVVAVNNYGHLDRRSGSPMPRSDWQGTQFYHRRAEPDSLRVRSDDALLNWNGFCVDFTRIARNGAAVGSGEVGAPAWFLAAVTLAGPALWTAKRLWRAKRLWSRRRRGLCPSCAYDLTGNVSGVCPECGSTAPGGRTS